MSQSSLPLTSQDNQGLINEGRERFPCGQRPCLSVMSVGSKGRSRLLHFFSKPASVIGCKKKSDKNSKFVKKKKKKKKKQPQLIIFNITKCVDALSEERAIV